MSKNNDKIEKITLEIETCSKWHSSTDDPIELYIGDHEWILDKPQTNEFERGQKDTFNLEVPSGIDPSWFNYLCLRKHVGAIRGDDWCLKAIKLEINDKIVYEKDNINVWLKGNKKHWCAPGFTYGQAGRKKPKKVLKE
ncbi:MAG: hypothetical protein HGN29_17765 [Asgard group archaeon]|nr:hypothetical protein [Asgard group archaeon]